MTVPIPPRLVDAAVSDGRQSWLAAVPATVVALRDRWSLTIAEPFEPGGHTAWVSPAIDVAGTLFARCIQESLDWPHLAELARPIAPT
jgi:hypothetical protein